MNKSRRRQNFRFSSPVRRGNSRIKIALFTLILIVSLMIAIQRMGKTEKLSNATDDTEKTKNDEIGNNCPDRITGSELLQMTTQSNEKNLTSPFLGCTLIHHSWKKATLTAKMEKRIATWKITKQQHSTRLTTIIWTDSDNDHLISSSYPSYLETYNLLPLTVMKTDLARLLYLHSFGGIYADTDYEVHIPYVDWPLSKDKQIYIVRSPYLVSEVFQNSLIIAQNTSHPFFLAVADSIREVVSFINVPDCNIGGCQNIGHFRSFFTWRIAYAIYAIFITGPGILDKAYVRLALESPEVVKDVGYLSSVDFFGVDGKLGKYATHWHDNTWIPSPLLMVPEIVLLVIMTWVLTLLGAYRLGKRRKRNLRSQFGPKKTNGSIYSRLN